MGKFIEVNKEPEKKIGYKGFEKGLIASKGEGGKTKYRVGGEYKIEHEGTLSYYDLCSSNVIHYCNLLEDVNRWYEFIDNYENYDVCEIEILGQFYDGNHKSGTDHMRILRIIPVEELKSIVRSGRNIGNFNDGDHNTGDHNSGDDNTGDSNSGSYNTGDSNSGSYNTGNSNIGDRNTGAENFGHRNSGDSNEGNYNTGDSNIGSRNTGENNLGNYNSGSKNMGDRNSGSYNLGHGCSGFFNLSDHSSGFFNTVKTPLYMFDKPIENYEFYQIKNLIERCNIFKKIDLKEIKNNKDFKEYFLDLWKNSTDEERKYVTDLPNFNWKSFKKITGVSEDWETYEPHHLKKAVDKWFEENSAKIMAWEKKGERFVREGYIFAIKTEEKNYFKEPIYRYVRLWEEYDYKREEYIIKVVEYDTCDTPKVDNIFYMFEINDVYSYRYEYISTHKYVTDDGVLKRLNYLAGLQITEAIEETKETKEE